MKPKIKYFKMFEVTLAGSLVFICFIHLRSQHAQDDKIWFKWSVFVSF